LNQSGLGLSCVRPAAGKYTYTHAAPSTVPGGFLILFGIPARKTTKKTNKQKQKKKKKQNKKKKTPNKRSKQDKSTEKKQKTKPQTHEQFSLSICTLSDARRHASCRYPGFPSLLVTYGHHEIIFFFFLFGSHATLPVLGA